jgi:hypothetical protein
VQVTGPEFKTLRYFLSGFLRFSGSHTSHARISLWTSQIFKTSPWYVNRLEKLRNGHLEVLSRSIQKKEDTCRSRKKVHHTTYSESVFATFSKTPIAMRSLSVWYSCDIKCRERLHFVFFVSSTLFYFFLFNSLKDISAPTYSESVFATFSKTPIAVRSLSVWYSSDIKCRERLHFVFFVSSTLFYFFLCTKCHLYTPMVG